MVPRELVAALTPAQRRFFNEPHHPQFDREGFEQFRNLEPLGWKTISAQRI